MEAYTGFAKVYDTFMENIPYQEWADALTCYLYEHGIGAGSSVAELGCGTGTFSLLLANSGFQVTGIDCSKEMLSIAEKKLRRYPKHRIHFIHQDMTELQLPSRMDAVVSVCDSMNYIVDEVQLQQCFCSVYANLREGGIFVFDLKTEEFYRDELADHTFAENDVDCAYIWNNYYDTESGINEYELTVFVREKSGKYSRYDEIHRQRAYSADTIAAMLRIAGFGCHECFTLDLDGANLERVYYLAVK